MIDEYLTLTGQSQAKRFVPPTLDGAEQGSVVTVEAGAWVTINALTITGGKSEFGGGILYQGGTLTLNDSIVSGNTADKSGGGIYGWGTLTLNNSTVSGNTAGDDGGGIFGSSLTLNNSTVSDNTAGEIGGGIRHSGTLTVNDSSVSGNSALHARGLWLDGTATLTDSTISDNNATGVGGGILICRFSTVDACGVTISGDTADRGGGVFNDVGRLNLRDGSAISGNTATSNGGGVWVFGFFVIVGWYPEPWGVVTMAAGPGEPSTGSISNNTAGVHGAGIYVDGNGGFPLYCRDGVNVFDNHLTSGDTENIYKGAPY